MTTSSRRRGQSSRNGLCATYLREGLSRTACRGDSRHGNSEPLPVRRQKLSPSAFPRRSPQESTTLLSRPPARQEQDSPSLSFAVNARGIYRVLRSEGLA